MTALLTPQALPRAVYVELSALPNKTHKCSHLARDVDVWNVLVFAEEWQVKENCKLERMSV